MGVRHRYEIAARLEVGTLIGSCKFMLKALEFVVVEDALFYYEIQLRKKKYFEYEAEVSRFCWQKGRALPDDFWKRLSHVK